jgi:hypothetical protein
MLGRKLPGIPTFRDLAVSRFRVQEAHVRICSDCNFFVRPYERTERPHGAGLIGKSLFQAVKLQTVRQAG